MLVYQMVIAAAVFEQGNFALLNWTYSDLSNFGGMMWNGDFFLAKKTRGHMSLAHAHHGTSMYALI